MATLISDADTEAHARAIYRDVLQGHFSAGRIRSLFDAFEPAAVVVNGIALYTIAVFYGKRGLINLHQSVLIHGPAAPAEDIALIERLVPGLGELVAEILAEITTAQPPAA